MLLILQLSDHQSFPNSHASLSYSSIHCKYPMLHFLCMLKERIPNETHIPWGVFMSNNANVALKASSCSCSLSGSSTFCLPPLRVWTLTYCHTFPKAALLFANRCARVSSFSISHQSTLKSLWTSGVSCFIKPCGLSCHTLCGGRDVTWPLDWLMRFACPIFFMNVRHQPSSLEVSDTRVFT